MADLSRARLAEEVEQLLRRRILNGDIATGTRLLQIQLAERLGVSRTPLREALWALERDGLVRISNGNKTVEVVDIELDHLIDLYEVRETIDAVATRLLAQRVANGEAKPPLLDCLNRMERAAQLKRPDLAHYADALSAFHVTILECCGNPQLLMFLPVVRLTTQVQTYRFVQRTERDSPASRAASEVSRLLGVGNEGYRRIYDAIMAGRVRQAEAAARDHIREAVIAAKEIRDRVRGEAAASA